MPLPYPPAVPWLPARTIYLTRHGSHAYGTSLATSDEDVKGVAIPPREVLHGFLQRFEQAEAGAPGPDVVIYDLRKFMALAADCNPSLIEVLWTAPEDHLLVTPLGERLLAARAAFLSRKARYTFAGYAIAQLKRIQTHHRWLVAPPAGPPARADFGLPERSVMPTEQLAAAQSAIAKRLESWTVDADAPGGLDPATKIELERRLAEMYAELSWTEDARHRAAGRSLGYDENFLLLLDRERSYRTRQREWEQFQSWKSHRNPARAALEAQFGYDTKHAMHLVRLLRMCREILATGRVQVRRADREELLAIRAGAWRYEQLLAWAAAEDQALDDTMRASPLPHAPDRVALDALCVSLIEASLGAG